MGPGAWIWRVARAGLLALGAAVAAAAPAPSPASVADAVLAAVAQKDAAALASLAASDSPDPWLVADELLARGEPEAAAAFAVAAPRPDVERLPAYVESRRGKPDDADARAALAAAQAALDRRDGGAARRALGELRGEPGTVVAVRVAHARGALLLAAARLEGAAGAFLAAADAAEALGWSARASQALQQAVSTTTQRGEYPRARELAERHVLLEERRGARLALASAWGELGTAHVALGDPVRGRELHERALRVQQELGERRAAAATLGNLAIVEQTLGNRPAALALYERAGAIFRELGDRLSAAKLLGNVGALRQQLGGLDQAQAAFEQALAAYDEFGDRVGVARALGNLGALHLTRGDLAKAQEILQRALDAKLGVGDRAGAAATLGNLGLLHRTAGDYPRALTVLEQALREKQALGDRAGAAATLSNLGSVHCALGSYAKALEIHERALREKEAIQDRAGVAVSLGNLGVVHDALGDHARALTLFQRARAAKEALGDRLGALEALTNVGNAQAGAGHHEQALETYREALGLRRALGDRPGVAETLANMGAAHDALGQHAPAAAAYEEALREIGTVGDRVRSAHFLGNLATVHAHMGDHVKALELGQRALEELEAVGERAGVADRLWGIARSKALLGDAAGALQAARRGVELLAGLFTGLAERQGAAARERYAGLHEVGLAVAAGMGSTKEAAYFLEAGRAGALLDSFQAREALRSGLLPPALLLAEAEARGREAAAVTAYRRSLLAEDREARRALKQAMESAQDASRDAVERIQREAKRAASVVYPRAAELSEIERALAPDEALVLYGVGEGPCWALLARRRGSRLVRLAARDDLERAVGEASTSSPGGDPVPALAALARLVVEPLALEPDVRRVLVAPAGALGYVPFPALLPEHEVVYEPSGTTYALLREEAAPEGRGVLALGDPDYGVARDAGADAAYARGGSLRFDPLPATRAEAQAVGDVLLLGRGANESELAAAVGRRPRWRSVHLACHGVVDPERPEFCFLALAADEKNDGFLTALEVFRSRIPADLVVLSACETGKGKVVQGEGIVGLTRAFMLAGAPRVVCSLWKVDDAATAALMTKFYELWNPKDGAPGLTAAAALRRAQEFVRHQERWSHPYYWAAWVLWGLP